MSLLMKYMLIMNAILLSINEDKENLLVARPQLYLRTKQYLNRSLPSFTYTDFMWVLATPIRTLL